MTTAPSKPEQLRKTLGYWDLLAYGLAYIAPIAPLSTLGFYQYLSPTIQLLMAVALFGEPFTRMHCISFGLIWAALGLYTWDAIAKARARS